MEESDVVDGYLLVVDYLLNHGSGIADSDRYLAIDTAKTANLTPGDKTRLILEMGKHNMQLLNKTLEQLEDEGYIQRTNFENGVLLIIEDQKMEANAITMDATYDRGGLFAHGMLDFSIRNMAGHWEMSAILSTWVA